MSCGGWKYKSGAQCAANCDAVFESKYESKINCYVHCLNGRITVWDRLFGRCWGE